MGDYHINIFFSEEDGCYVADIPDLEYCSALVKHLNRPWPKLSRPRKPGWPRPRKPASPSRRLGIGP